MVVGTDELEAIIATEAVESGPGPRRAGRATAARTRIVGWVLLLVLASLGIVTLLTWMLLIDETDRRIDGALNSEIAEFARVTETGVNPTTGQPYSSVDEILRSVIAANVARPNEKFLGYLDGRFRWESRRTSPRVLLREDPAFAALVADVRRPTRGSYLSSAGEVRWSALPVGLAGDPQRGVIVIGYFTEREHDFAHEAARLMGLVGFGTALLSAVGAWLVAGRILRPLRDVAATARTITGRDLSRRVPQRARARDEIAELATTLNAMLDRVQSGMVSQRRFVDDAGHELRTPITIVRGHLELMGEDPEENAATRHLVLDELGRMQRIVDDLLVLAKSGSPDFLAPGDTDLADLTVETLAKSRPLADRVWRLDAVAEATVRADGQRLTQALLQLVSNAVRHTSPGQEIALGSEVTATTARLWVRDTGEGVPSDSRSRIFERFKRGSNSSGDDGAGLGLAIVVAIAEAHGGRVLLDTVPGEGARFTMEIPVAGGAGR